jgi:hypothetical protein
MAGVDVLVNTRFCARGLESLLLFIKFTRARITLLVARCI